MAVGHHQSMNEMRFWLISFFITKNSYGPTRILLWDQNWLKALTEPPDREPGVEVMLLDDSVQLKHSVIKGSWWDQKMQGTKIQVSVVD